MDGKHDDENTQLSFLTLSAATKNVLRYLETSEQKKEERDRDTGRDRTEKQDSKDHRDYVDQRLRELAAFEQRYDGNKRRKV